MKNKIVFLKDTSLTGQDSTKEFYALFLNVLRDRGLQNTVQIVRVADIGIYDKGIAVKILPQGIVYANLKDSDISRIVDSTLREGKTIEELLLKEGHLQLRIVLRNCGVVDPDSIDDYIAHGGYQALKKVLLGGTPEKVIDELKKSGLRGRGGAGYPTWLKWNFARTVMADQKFVICNGDEGDPGAYMDRSVLEGDPHSVVEGMMIAGFTVGASRGYFYIRAEYPLAVERVQRAIDHAYEAGLLGEGVLGTSFNFDLEIRLGAGAFVCGEETALIASIEGKRGTPHPRPPYPSVKGLWDKPTVINNVETIANVAYILLNGGDKFAKVGTSASKGTKVFALTGKVRNSGLVEVPMGTTLRQIIFDIGGGISSGKQLKAVQTGGPSGGVIPKEFIDMPVDYENLQKLGSIMGSGGMIVMDEDDCMVDIAKFYQRFCFDESCGKCAPCRIGTTQMLNILERVTEGRGVIEDVALLKRISYAMQKASLCGLGQSAPNPVVSTLKYFEEEYNRHIVDKKCPSKKCKPLLSYRIISERCKKCGLCMVNCAVKAVSGNKDTGYSIDLSKCVKCGRCFETCKFKAIARD